MEIILVRHTSVGVPRGVCYGNTDIPVSDNFQREADWVREQIGDWNPDAVYSSPLSRCTLLAKQVYPDFELELHDKLKEFHYGDWEMLTWDDIGVKDNSDWMYINSAEKAPKGESFEDLRARVYPVIEEIRSKGHKKTAVFCHGGVIRSVLSKVLNMEMIDTKALKIYYAAQVHLVFEENRWKLIGLNGGYPGFFS